MSAVNTCSADGRRRWQSRRRPCARRSAPRRRRTPSRAGPSTRSRASRSWARWSCATARSPRWARTSGARRRQGRGRHRQADLPGNVRRHQRARPHRGGRGGRHQRLPGAGQLQPPAPGGDRGPSRFGAHPRGAGQRHHAHHRGPPGGQRRHRGTGLPHRAGRMDRRRDGHPARRRHGDELPQPGRRRTPLRGRVLRRRRPSFADSEAQYKKEVAELDEWMDAGRHYIKAKAAGRVSPGPEAGGHGEGGEQGDARAPRSQRRA